MSAPAVTSPAELVRRLFDALDALDTARIEALAAADVQGVDELSGGWMRGRDAVHGYFERIKAAGLTRLRSTASDVATTEWGDAAVVTLVLDQTYTFGRQEQRIHAPTSIVLRREGGEWRFVLFHSVPLPEEG
jgi:uncharacterized protein (TIGR02246 family)